MKTLIIATSKKPKNWDEEIRERQRYRIDYLNLSENLPASYMDYDAPWMHRRDGIRKLEEKLHVDFYWAREIAALVKQKGYDRVVSMSERISVPLALFLPRNVKHITIFLNPFSPKWLFVIKMLKIHQRWEKIITLSQAEAIALQHKLEIPREKFHVIHYYVDTDFFRETEERYPEINGQYIFSQGLADRDYPTLIRAMQELPHIECHISAVSAWDKHGPDFRGVTIPKNVILKPYNHPFIIREALAKSQFSVIPLDPKTGDWCAGATSVLQAQALGKPIVVTKLLGIAEYLRDGETGFLVKGGDHHGVAKIIDHLWKNPDLAEKIGQTGKTWVRENFSLECWTDKIMRLLEVV